MIEKILKEFERKFGNWKDPFLYFEIYPWVEEKLTAFEQSIRAEDKKEYDLSEWRKVGVERGYWAYFQKEVREDFLKRILPGRINNENDESPRKYGRRVGHNLFRDELIKNAEKDGVKI